MTIPNANIVRLDAEDAQRKQSGEAEHGIWIDGGGICYPYADLDAVAAPIQQGEVDILAGDTGMGKTTIVCSMIARWLQDGVQIVYHGSEMPPKIMRTYL